MEQFKIVFVVKGECLIARDTDSDTRAVGTKWIDLTLHLREQAWRFAPRMLKQRTKIKIIARDLSKLGGALRRTLFFAGIQTEVAFRDSNARVSGNATEERRRCYFSNRDLQHAIVVGTRNTVQNGSGKTQLRVETFETFKNCCNTARAVRRIENQHHWKIQKLGNFRCAAFVGPATDAVIEPHHAFNDGDIGSMGSALENSAVGFAVQHPGIDVAGGASANGAVVTCI